MIKLYRNLKPYTVSIIFIILFIFGQVMSDLYLPTVMSNIINNGIMEEDIGYIWHEGLFMLAVSGAGVILAILASLLSSKVAMKLGYTLRNQIFTKVENFSLYEFDKFGSATLITRTTNDIVQIQTVTILIFTIIARAPLMFIGGTIQALAQDKILTLVLLAALPFVILIIILMAKFVVPIFKRVQSKIDKINLVLRENLTGIRVIRAFNREKHEMKRFDAANRDLTDTYIKVNRIIAFLMPAVSLIMNGLLIAICWFGAIRVDSDEMNLGALVAFIQYAIQIMFSIVMVTIMFVIFPRAEAAADRINEVLETEPEINDAASVQHAGQQKGYVEFRNVSYRYHGAEETALRNISFNAKPGEITAIIGGTGSGKSTLVNLIPRFYDVESGEILIDGVNIKNMPQKELRAKIGFVPQKALLFTGTIADNLRYGRKEATDEEIRHAADIAQATEFISKMDNGFDTMLYEGGLNLSGGQKQRLSIARALTRKAEIYVFDDSFSALDFKTDAKLRAALKEVTKASTVFIVAQRVSSVMDADRIIVLDDGAVAGIGTHDELLKTCEVYREIVSSQLSEEELA
jgi:ATP-binding cassette subfamily B multidrug efflux pump